MGDSNLGAPQAGAPVSKTFLGALAYASTQGQEELNSGEVIYEDDLEDESIPEEQRITRANNVLPLWGNQHSMNLNHLVLENVLQSPYYKTLMEKRTFDELIEEIWCNVSHLEPWERGTRRTTGQTGMCGGVRGVGAGGVVSSAYCIMYRLYKLGITRKQLVALVNYNDAPFIRGLGLLFIRYCQPPATLWGWLEYYLDDEEEIDPKAGGGDPINIGAMVKLMLTKLDWYGTLFPRIPVPIQKILDQKFRERIERKLKEQRSQEKRDNAALGIDPAAEEAEKAKERESGRDRERDRDRPRSRDKERRRSRSRDRDGRERRRTSRDRSRRSRSRERSSRRSRSPRSRRSPRRDERRSSRDRSRTSKDRRRSPESTRRDSKAKETPTKEEPTVPARRPHKPHTKGRHHHCKRRLAGAHAHHHHDDHDEREKSPTPNSTNGKTE